MLNRLLQRVRPSTLLGFGGTAVCCAAAYRFAWQMEYQKSEGELHFWNKYVSNAVKLLAASTVSLAAGYALRKRLCAVEGMKRFLLAVAPLSLSGACGYVAHVNPLTDYHARDMWADAALMLGGVTVGIAGVYFWPHALGILSHLALNAPLAYLHTQSDGCYMEGMSPFVISLASVFLSVALNPFLGAAMGAQTISALSFVAAAGSAMGCMLPLHIFFRHRNIDVDVDGVNAPEGRTAYSRSPSEMEQMMHYKRLLQLHKLKLDNKLSDDELEAAMYDAAEFEKLSKIMEERTTITTLARLDLDDARAVRNIDRLSFASVAMVPFMSLAFCMGFRDNFAVPLYASSVARARVAALAGKSAPNVPRFRQVLGS
ncbi:MAG: hypothetical protein MHM6MM_001131 [Cercozoa sp. M6MM]